MPEGPSIVIVKEAVQFLTGKTVTAAEGNTSLDKEQFVGQKILDFKSWGKHFLICFQDFTLRVHFMMFGTYRVNERKPTPVRLGLTLGEDELNLYTCSLQVIEGDLDLVYDWEEDIMSPVWNEKKAIKKTKASGLIVSDALLDQHLFSGSGNIIKNEVLYRVRIHPLCLASALPPKKLHELVAETRHYAFDFLEWKKEYTLRKHWLAYKKRVCKRCDLPFSIDHLGKGKRLTYFCMNCQVNYNTVPLTPEM